MGNTGTEIVSPILDKRKGRRDTPHMGHSSPLIYLLSREYPCGWSSGLHPESAISVMKEPMDMVQSVHTALWKSLVDANYKMKSSEYIDDINWIS